MELGQVGGVERLVAEDAVDAEVLDRPESVLGQPVEHPRRYGRRVRPQQVLLRLLHLFRCGDFI